MCEFTYEWVNFTNNKALEKGGAYFYPEWRPVFNDIYFYNNSAQYGNDIGSLPIKIYLDDQLTQNIHLKDIPSG